MKKRGLFLALVAFAGAAIVGGTFAAWAVTDNADPVSIKVSTGNVTSDSTQFLTLKWGDQQTLSNVSNLVKGTFRKAAVLDLGLDTTSTDTDYDGKLSYTLNGGADLKAKLIVEVYKTNLADTDGVIASSEFTGKTKLSFTNGVCNITSTNLTANGHNPFTVVVSLDPNTTVSELDAMSKQQVSVVFDWGAGENSVETTTVYATGFSAQPYMYCWDGSKVNASWPGVAMTRVGSTNYYQAELNLSYVNVIFTTQDESQKSGDIAISSSFSGANNLFTYDGSSGTAKGTFGTYSGLATPVYKLVGDEFGNWDPSAAGAISITVTNGTGTVQITTTKVNSEFKVLDTANNIWYGPTSTNDGNFVINSVGTYTITFTPAGPTYITCA